MERLTLDEWKNVFSNLAAEGAEVEVVWLESTDEWVLCHESELFEDGYTGELEAEQRLQDIYRQLADSSEFKDYDNASYNRYEREMKEAGHRPTDFS